MPTVASCPDCGFPIGVNAPGEIQTCVNCGTKIETISGISALTLSNSFIVGVLAFIAGAVLSPKLRSQSTRGWVADKVRG